MEAGAVVPDYGGRNATFEVAQITPPTALVYWSSRGRISLTWSLTLEPAGNDPDRTRVFLRLRMAPVRHKLLARTAGGLIDLLTIAGMAAGRQNACALPIPQPDLTPEVSGERGWSNTAPAQNRSCFILRPLRCPGLLRFGQGVDPVA